MISNRRALQRNVRQANALRLILQAAAPRCHPDVVSAIAVDLADLARVAAKHQQHVRKLLTSKRRSGLERVLAQIDVNLLFEANYHVKSLRKNLPKLVNHLPR
jgi:hypothetical protein